MFQPRYTIRKRLMRVDFSDRNALLMIGMFAAVTVFAALADAWH